MPLRTLIILMYMYACILKISCFWPPPYKVELDHEETFVIDEHLEKKDIQDVYDEEELLKEEDMKADNVQSNSEKYYRIHQSVRENNENVRDNSFKEQIVKKQGIYEETNPDQEEPLPWKAGFIDKSGNIRDDKEIIYFDEIAKNNANKQKREDEAETKEENYDYSQFKSEFDKNVKKDLLSNNTLNYTDTKEDESLKDSIKKLVEKTPRNCTEEERNSIGIAAIECLVMDARKPKMRSRVLAKILRIVLIWTFVYLVIALPLWCQYGWCCCCCRCKFCRPREEIDSVRKFFAENPVGVYHDKDGELIRYPPTYYEKYAQKKLEKEIQRL